MQLSLCTVRGDTKSPKCALKTIRDASNDTLLLNTVSFCVVGEAADKFVITERIFFCEVTCL